MVQVGIVGYGSVGKALARHACAIGIRVVAVADSSGVLVQRNGFTNHDLSILESAKDQGTAFSNLPDYTHVSLDRMIDHMNSHITPIVADTSASDSTTKYLKHMLKENVPVALANKKPLSMELADFDTLTANRALIRFESTCGAGLPTMESLRRILDSGDHIKQVQGQFSGTLGYILSGLQEGGKLSDIVAEAKSLGYTEPDPRDDLSGVDVARKALIIARCMGSRINLSDVEIEPLFPDEFSDLSIEEFMRRLPELDEEMLGKVKAADAKGCRLRYAAVVNPDSVKVGLVEVEEGSPLAGLSGTDNLVSYQTEWYSESPMVISGPGAGIDVTAGGVLSDIVMLSQGQFRQTWGLTK